MLEPSLYQQSIYDWVREGSGSASVIAVAGSGKTSTILEALRFIPAARSVRLFAFNRQIAGVLKARVPYRHVEVSTYHSAGYRAILRELHTKVDTDKFKTKDLIREQLDDTDRRAYGDELARLISLAKSVGVGVLLPDRTDIWQDLINDHDLDFDYLLPPGRMSEEALEQALKKEQARVIGLTQALFDAGNRAAEEPFAWRIDFDDQLYLPIRWDLPLQQYDWVIVDEAQDTNRIQRELIRRSLKPGGRLLCVGDPNQSIYAWRGASHDAMTRLREDFDCVELPLSVCYRCGRAIVEKAQAIVPQIEAWTGSPEGTVVEDAPRTALAALSSTDAILCRNNAPLISTAYDLIGQGIPCQVLGRDIGEGLKKLVYKLRPISLSDLHAKLGDFERKETQRFRKLRLEGKAQGVIDRVACLRTICEQLETTPEQETDGLGEVEQVCDAIDRLFGDPQVGRLTLSTIHKAKGQEWSVVAIIGHWLLPSKWATTPEALQQEENLRYVAYTRAKERLLIVDDKPEWMRKKERREREEEGVSS